MTPSATRTTSATHTNTPVPSASPTATRTDTATPTQTPTDTRPTATATQDPNACGNAEAPQCDGACPAGTACVNVGDACQCVTGVGPCGLVVGAPSCWGNCPPEAPICVTVGGSCVCVDEPLATPTHSATPEATATRTATRTRTSTPTATEVPPTATATLQPGETPPTAAPTATETSVPPTGTPTATPQEPTPTATATETEAPTATETAELTPRNPPETPTPLPPSPTATRITFATRTATITPTASPSALPDDTEGPTAVPTETPTATPSPTVDRDAQNNTALFVASGMGGGERVAIHYLRPPRRSRQQMLVAFATDGAHSEQAGPIVPVSGDVDGDGAAELVVGQSSDGTRIISDQVAVYRVVSGRSPELLDEIGAFDRGSSGSGNLTVADVDPSVPGSEILVGEDGSSRRASAINVLGGLADGPLRLLHSLRAISTHMAEHRPVTFVTGELDPDSGGDEIVVAQPNGYVSVHTLTAAGPSRLQRFDPFADQAEPTAPTSLALGDVLPGNPGNELVTAVSGKRGTGLVRVFDPLNGVQLAEISVFTPGSVRMSVSIWVDDVIDTLPGAEIIVGRGTEGGDIVVYSFSSGSARRLFSFPDALQRATAMPRFLAIGDLIPNMAGPEVAVAQNDAAVPIAVYQLTAQAAKHVMSIPTSTMGTIGAIAAPAHP